MAGCRHYWVLSPAAADVVRRNDHEDLTRSGGSGTAAPALPGAA